MKKYLFLYFLLVIIPIKAYAQEDSDVTMMDISQMSLKELMNVKVVTASGFSEKVKDVPASVIIMTKDDICKLGYSNLQEILANIPGLYMIDDYYWLGSVNYGVRGFFSAGPFNDMIIMINGVNQVSDKYSDYPDVKINVPVASIERIEVIRGPMSVIYGSGAFFGAINIITTNFENHEPKSSICLSYGEYNRQKLHFNHSGSAEQINYSLDLAMDHTDGIDNPITDLTDDYGLINYVGLDSNATLDGQKDDSRKYFHIALDFKNLNADISYAETKKDIFDGQPNYYGGSQMTTHAANLILGYKKEFSDNLKGKIQFGYYSHSHVIDYNIFRPQYYEIDAQQTHSYDIEADFNYIFRDNLDIILGLNRRTALDIHQISDFAYYSLNAGHGEITLPNDEDFSTNSIFTQIKYSPIDNLKLIGGLRLDHYEDYNMLYARGIITENPDDERPPDSLNYRRITNGTFNPDNNGLQITSRIAALYTIDENNVIKFMFGEATKQPSFSENYRQLPNGDPQLEAAKIQTSEINYIGIYTNKLSINASIFHNQLDNLISTTNIYDHTSGEWQIFSSNSGKMQTTGLEIGIKVRPFENLILNLSGVYQKSKNLKDGYEDITLGYSPELLSYFSAIYTMNDISLSISGRTIGEMETLWKTDTEVENGYRIGNKIDAYAVFNLNLRYNNLFNSKAFAAIKISNILDEEIRYPTTTSNAWATKGTLGFGRNILFSLGWEF